MNSMNMWMRFAAILLICLTSCAHQTPKTRLVEPAATTIEWALLDSAQAATQTPENLQRAVEKTLLERGFEVGEGSPQYVVSVNATTRRFMRVNNAYRWVVQGSVALKDSSGAVLGYKTWSHAHYLDVEFAAEPRVLSALSSEIAAEVDDVVHDVLLTRAVALPQSKATANATQKTERSSPNHAELGDAIYFVMVDRFANGNPANDRTVDLRDPQAFHGGDIEGLIKNLDWIESLGIRTIWLSPVFKMRDTPFFGHGAFHGYWLEDPFTIEPRFGDEAAMIRLRDELAKRKMRLMLDIVVNHVAPESERVKTHAHWFHPHGPITDWNDPVQLETYQVHGLPDLDQTNSEVYAWILESTLKWVRLLEPDGLRMDAVKHVPAAFWRKFNADVQKVSSKPLMILGEHLDGDVSRVAQTANAGGFNAMFDFPLHFAMIDVFCKDAPPGRLASVLAQDSLYENALGPHREGLVTLLDNHDLSRVISSCLGDRDRVVQAMRFMLSVRGTPSFTWGTEVGIDGSGEPENRSSMRFESNHPMLPVMQDLLQRRRNNPVLVRGEDHVLELDDDFYGLLRIDDSKVAAILVNGSSALRTVELPPELHEARKSIEVPANSTEVVMINADATSIKALQTRLKSLKGSTTRIEVEGVTLKSGQKLVLAGSLPGLGAWDPSRAPAFKQEGTKWVLELKLPAGSVAASKLVVISNADTTWEQRPDRFFMAREGQHTLRIFWQR